MNSGTDNVVLEMKKMLNETIAMNESSSKAVHFINESISEALLQEQREKNISRVAEQSFKKAEEAAKEMKTQMEKVEKLRDEINQFNSNLNKTRRQLEKEWITRNKTQTDVDNIKVLKYYYCSMN